MERFTFTVLVAFSLTVCILNNRIIEIREGHALPGDEIQKAGFFQDVGDFIEDLFDGDGNVNGTPGDPYNITLGKNGTHGGSWARDDHPYTIFNNHIDKSWQGQ